jgi:hypothetical protein
MDGSENRASASPRRTNRALNAWRPKSLPTITIPLASAVGKDRRQTLRKGPAGSFNQPATLGLSENAHLSCQSSSSELLAPTKSLRQAGRGEPRIVRCQEHGMALVGRVSGPGGGEAGGGCSTIAARREPAPPRGVRARRPSAPSRASPSSRYRSLLWSRTSRCRRARLGAPFMFNAQRESANFHHPF